MSRYFNDCIQFESISKDIESNTGSEKFRVFTDCLSLFFLIRYQLGLPQRQNLTRPSFLARYFIQLPFSKYVDRLLMIKRWNSQWRTTIGDDDFLGLCSDQWSYKRPVLDITKSISAYDFSMVAATGEEIKRWRVCLVSWCIVWFGLFVFFFGDFSGRALAGHSVRSGPVPAVQRGRANGAGRRAAAVPGSGGALGGRAQPRSLPALPHQSASRRRRRSTQPALRRSVIQLSLSLSSFITSFSLVLSFPSASAPARLGRRRVLRSVVLIT